MSHVYVTSDWHLGHTGVSDKFRKQFFSDREHDEYIVANAQSTVTKRDVLYILGDVAFNKGKLDMLHEIKCRKILVRGNHDTLPISDYLEVFDEVYGAYKYKSYWLTHIPIHPMELYRGVNIHGHCHRGGPFEVHGDPYYYNAILEYNNYMPVNMQVVGSLIQDRIRLQERVRSANEGKAGNSECN